MDQCNYCGNGLFTPEEKKYSLCAGCLEQSTQTSGLQKTNPLVEQVEREKRRFIRSIKNKREFSSALLKVMRRDPGKVALMIVCMIYILFK